MSSAYNRGNSQPAQHTETTEAQEAQPAAKPVGSQMLEQVLAMMSGRTPSKGFVEPEDVKGLQQVAETFAGQPFSLAPVAIELVHAILCVQFQKAQLPSSTVRAMAEQLATTLYDDPNARARLEIVWKGLSEGQ